MPLLDQQNPCSKYVDALDRRLANGIRDFVRSNTISMDELARGFSELRKIRTPETVNYYGAGVTVAYAFKYFAIRCSSVLFALQSGKVPRPLSTLDLGSGSDAVGVALSLWAPSAPISLTSIEPSEWMASFGERLLAGTKVVRTRRRTNLQSWCDSAIPIRYDLIVMSACLQDELWTWNNGWEVLSTSLLRASKANTHIVIIEPNVDRKKSLQERLVATMQSSGFVMKRLEYPSCASDILDSTTQLLQNEYGPFLVDNSMLSPDAKKFLGNRPWPVENWNDPKYPDRIVVARRA